MNDYYIQGDSITSYISNAQFFPIAYYDKYIKKFAKNTKLITKFREISTIKEPLIIITKIEYLEQLNKKILYSLKTDFVLITHYGDCDSGLNNQILNHPYLLKWYGLNMVKVSDKTEAIPIGLENNFFKRTNIEVLNKCSKNVKNKLLYLNFSLNTNPNRTIIMNKLLEKKFIKNNNLPWKDYIQELSEYKFCISPQGNGIDCHRTWECLYLGVIPIVEKSTVMNAFNDLPILFVENYDNITIEYLNSIYEEKFKNKKFNLEKLDLMYWDKKIKDNFKN